MAISVGSVEVDVVPNTQGIQARLRAALVPAATRAGEDAGSAAGRAFGPAMQGKLGDIGMSIGEQIGKQVASRIQPAVQNAFRDGVTVGGQKARPAAARQGEETGGAFARAIKARLEVAFKSLPKADIGLSDTGVDADLARLRAKLESLAGKRVGIDIDVASADAQIADVEARLDRLGAEHPNIAVRVDTAAARAQLLALREDISRVSAEPAVVRVETDGAFGQRLRLVVERATAALPQIKIDANTTPAQVELAYLRTQLVALSDQRVGIDIDSATATAKIDEIKARLQVLSASNADVSLRVDADAAVAQLAAVSAMVDALDAQKADITLGPDAATASGRGEEIAGAFARSVQARLEAAYTSMPKLNIGITDTGVDAELARVRAKLEALSTRRIGIDLSAEDANAKIVLLEEQLVRLGAAHPNVDVRADTAAATTALAEIRAEIARVSGTPAVVRVDTDGSFSQRMRAAVERAQASLPQIRINADTTPAQVELSYLRSQLTDLTDQRIGIDVDAVTATARIDAIRERLRALVESSATVDVRVDAAGAEAQLATIAALVDSLDAQTITLGPEPAAAARDGEEVGGAFARALKARLDVAFRSMPKLDVGLNDTGVDADLARLRARMETLATKRIGIDIDVASADAQLADMEERLLRLGALHPNVAVRADTAAARAQLATMREEIARLTTDPARVRVETDGSFGAKIRAQVAAAQASLPDINIHTRVDTTPADREIAHLRAALGALSDQRIGIDVSAGEATAKIDEIKIKLERLAVSGATVDVRVDAAAALAQLVQVQALADTVDGKTVKIDVDTSGALSAIFQLTVALGSIAVIPAIPILGAGLGALASAGVAAGAGVGAFAAVALPALSSIKNALSAQTQAQDAAATATAKGSAGNGQAAAKALQMAGAQQALASAERNGARQIAQAQDQVRQARQAVTDAVQQGALQQQQAARAVSDAERQLAQAQKDAKQAQLDLTAARKQAGQELEDLNNQLKDGVLSQRAAVLAVQRAQIALDATKAAGSNASALQQQEAQLALDQAKQGLVDQGVRTKRLEEQTKAANKAGVEGSATVKSAQDKVVTSQQAVIDRTVGLRDAQASAARVQVQSARAIADAQKKVVDAQNNVGQAQAQAADSIASAQRQIASSSAQAASGTNAAATAQEKYEQALAKLTPSARGTFDAFVSLRSAFKSWSESLQPAVMPIFTRAIIGLKNSLPGLTPFVVNAAKALKILQDRASAGFKSPWWKSFKTDLAGSVVPAIVGLGSAVGRIFKGLGGIVDAFLPHMDEISARMQRITGRFANWGAGLKGSPAFEKFLDYVGKAGPGLAVAIGKIVGAFADVSKALAPLTGPALQVFGILADGISKVATVAPGVVQLIYGIYVMTRLATVATVAYEAILAIWRAGVILATLLTEGWAAAIALANLTFEANPIVLLITLIVAAIALLVVGIIYAWNHFSWFRNGVLAVWGAIQVAALWAWNNVLKPVFNALAVVVMWIYNNVIKVYFALIVLYFHIVAAVAIWLWQNILSPTFSAIGAIFSAWWFGVKLYVALVWEALKFVGAGATWLWQHSLGPAFAEMGKLIGLWWAGVKLYAGFVMTIFGAIGDAALWLWSHGISPALGWIGDKAGWLWSHAIKPAFDSITWALGKVSDAFGTAKDNIGKAWDQIASLAGKPIKFIVDHVYNQGIVPLWNKVAGLVDDKHALAPLKLTGWATGGVLPGYTPGRDVHLAALSGGEAVMRPEWTRAVGPKYVHYMNAAARAGGVGGVQSALGLPGFSDGGIFGNAWDSIKSVGNTVKNAAGSVINGAENAAEFLTNPDKVFEVAGNWIRNQMRAFASSQWGQTVTKIPLSMLHNLKDSIFGGGGGAVGGEGVVRALAWARTQVGKPYQWGGGGDPSYDCSGFMAAIQKVILGESPLGRMWSTFSFQGDTAPSGWRRNAPSPFMIGVTNDGVGHTAGTLLGVNVESRGGTGIHVGPDARGATDALFQNRYGFMPARALSFDAGGWLPPGLNVTHNGTGQPEPIFTTQQASGLARLASAPGGGAGGGEFTGTLILDSGEFMGKIHGVLHERDAALATALRAGRG